jgi:ectoine hydroxylase-related dioxygenase (phytanoyl-CoA dioxygenase family)
VSALTPTQIEAFDTQGFLVIDDVFTPREVDDLSAAAESDAIRQPLAEKGAGERAVHLLELTTRHAAFAELARSDRILDRIRPPIGDDIQLQHSKIATKPPVPDAGPYRWHQDFAFFPHTNTDLVAVMVMLDDATPDNGCMRFVPGSHRLGLLNHLDADGMFAECQESHRWADPEWLVDITPRAGGISIHHCLMLHGSPVNRSGRPRRGLVFQYRADDAYQLADHVFADTGTLVSGQRRGRVRCEAGVLTLPRRVQEESPYGSAWNQRGALALAGNE